MPERLTIILNSLVSAILVVVLAGAIYLFIRTEHLTQEVGSINHQIGDLKEVASSTFEQTMRRFDEFGRQLSGIAPSSKNSSAEKVVPAPAKAPVKISPARQPVRHPKDPRKEQETKLNRDQLQFLAIRARVCRKADPTAARCQEQIKQLAARGNSAAQKWLGTEARDNQHELQMAVFWFEQAANQGDTDAMNSLGAIYGGSARQPDATVSDALADPMKALYWYGKSASLGDPDAMGAIAGIYQKGQLAPQNPHEAILWYEFASNAVASIRRGRAASTNFAGVLGDIYYNGSGVDPDKVQAYEWYAIACADATRLKIRGDASCATRNNVGGELSPVETAKAQALAAEWRKLHR